MASISCISTGSRRVAASGLRSNRRRIRWLPDPKCRLRVRSLIPSKRQPLKGRSGDKPAAATRCHQLASAAAIVMDARTSLSGPAAAPAAVGASRPAMSAGDTQPINRELSLLAFNHRVLSLASDPGTPLLERLRFLCIVGNNLDEFFEIRVVGIKEQLRARIPPARLTLQEARGLLPLIGSEVRALIGEQYRLLNEQVLPALSAAGVRLLRHADRTPAQRAWVTRYFNEEVRPLLTPIGLNPAHPFPQVVNKSLNFIVELSGRDAFGRDASVAIVRAPCLLPRVIKLPTEVATPSFLLLSSVIHAHLPDLFPGREVLGYSQFRVTRDADLWIDEEEIKNLRKALQGELPQRQFGSAVRLEVAANCPDRLAQLLLAQFDLGEEDLYRCDGPVNMMRLVSLMVVYGVFGLKTHAKMALLLRRETDVHGATRLTPYAHLGTGNYHPRTTRLYTDFGLLTADPRICADVNEVFLHITSLARAKPLDRLLLAPFTMHVRILQMIRRETRIAREGRPASIQAKMNGLLEERVIRALYAASQAGVRVELLVRGACALRPGVPGLSENITVRSLLGCFLEHQRVWYFENGGADSVWLSSADWMGRNLFGRIEVAFPVSDPALRRRVIDEALAMGLADEAGSWELKADGTWEPCRRDRGEPACSVQQDLVARMRAMVEPL